MYISCLYDWNSNKTLCEITANLIYFILFLVLLNFMEMTHVIA